MFKSYLEEKSPEQELIELKTKIQKDLKHARTMIKTYKEGEMKAYWSGIEAVLSDYLGEKSIPNFKG